MSPPRLVPQAWISAIGHLRAAQVERDVMRSPGVTQQGRDIAMARYVQSVDALIDCLERLSITGVLGRITLFLAQKVRS